MTAICRSLVAGLFIAGTAAVASAQTRAPTTLTLLPPPQIYAGVPTVVHYAISAESGAVPTGSVTITSADSSGGCTAAVSAGGCQLLLWTVGEETLTATYSGDAALLPSSDVRVISVLGGAYPTQTTIGEISPWPPMAGEPVRVDLRVSTCMPPFSSCPDLRGPITVSDEHDASVTCTLQVLDIIRGCTLTFQAAGVRTLRAVYAGAGAFQGSSDVRSLTVGPRVLAMADGVTGSFFDTYLLLANPGDTPEPVSMTLSKDDGRTTEVSAVVPPGARVTWKADAVATLGEGAFTTRVTVPSGHPVVVERATYFAEDYRAGHASLGRAPSTRAFFAEGSQNSVFDTYLLIGNPATETAYVHVRFLTEGGEPVNRNYVVPASIRLSVAASGIPELSGRSFGIDVSSSVPVTVERSMYFGQGYVGGHSDVGATRLSTTWLFAEGATAPPFKTFLLLANPVHPGEVWATIAYRTSTGRIVIGSHSIPEGGRVTIEVDREDPDLAATTFWAEVRSQVPIVVERSMYWSSNDGRSWTEGHVSAGATAPAPRWGFAEGIIGGGLGFKTFLLVANPGVTAATVDVRYLPTTAGPGPITRVHTVPALSRLTIDVEADVPALRDVPFGAAVSAREGGAIVAERSVYWTRDGPVFIGGTNTVGLPF